MCILLVWREQEQLTESSPMINEEYIKQASGNLSMHWYLSYWGNFTRSFHNKEQSSKLKNQNAHVNLEHHHPLIRIRMKKSGVITMEMILGE